MIELVLSAYYRSILSLNVIINHIRLQYGIDGRGHVSHKYRGLVRHVLRYDNTILENNDAILIFLLLFQLDILNNNYKV